MADDRYFIKKKIIINMRPSDYIRKLALIKELYLKDYVFNLAEKLGVPAEKLLRSEPIKRYYEWIKKEINKK